MLFFVINERLIKLYCVPISPKLPYNTPGDHLITIFDLNPQARDLSTRSACRMDIYSRLDGFLDPISHTIAEIIAEKQLIKFPAIRLEIAVKYQTDNNIQQLMSLSKRSVSFRKRSLAGKSHHDVFFSKFRVH